MDYCLWVEWLWMCSNYVNYELSVLNIGVFLTILWVFFAGYWLLNEIHKIRIWVRLKKRIRIPIVCILLVGALLSTLIPFIPWYSLPLLWYPIFWEILTAISILFFLLYITIIIRKPIKKINNKKVYRIFLNYVLKGKKIESLVNELQFFFDNIINIYIEEEKQSKHWDATDFLFLMQSEILIDSLIQNPITLKKIFSYDYQKTGEQIPYNLSVFLKKIIFESLSNSNSILSSELNKSIIIPHQKYWVLLDKVINTISIYRNKSFFEVSHYFQNEVFIKNYLIFTNQLIGCYFLQEGSMVLWEYRLLYNILESKSKVLNFSMNKEKIPHLKLLPDDFISKIINNIKDLQKWELKHDFNYEEIFTPWPDKDLNSIVDSIVLWSCELIDGISNAYDNDENKMRLELLKFKWIQEIEKWILLKMKYWIINNLEKWFYPNISKCFWLMYRWDIVNNKWNISNEVIEILKTYEKYLYNMRDSNQLKKDIFPSCISYNKKENKIIIECFSNTKYLDLNKIKEEWKVFIKSIELS